MNLRLEPYHLPNTTPPMLTVGNVFPNVLVPPSAGGGSSFPFVDVGLKVVVVVVVVTVIKVSEVEVGGGGDEPILKMSSHWLELLEGWDLLFELVLLVLEVVEPFFVVDVVFTLEVVVFVGKFVGKFVGMEKGSPPPKFVDRETPPGNVGKPVGMENGSPKVREMMMTCGRHCARVNSRAADGNRG